MTLMGLRAVLTIAAGFGLWRLWLSLARGDRRVARVVTAGFLVRAIGGQALFWISLLQLPIGESLQLGEGFWFFASDGPMYLASATEVAQNGPAALLAANGIYPSHTFVQILAVCVSAFGSVASVAILVNCAAFLATCAIIVRLGAGSGRVSPQVLVALAAVAFGPGTILWSFQLLKDTVFLLCIAAMAGACAWWQALWPAQPSTATGWRRAACAAAMCAVMFALAGMRWYFAVIVWAAFGAVFVLAAIPARRRPAALVASAALFVALGQSVRLGGDGDLPPIVGRVLNLNAPAALLAWPATAVLYVTSARRGFNHTPGGTMITTGPLLAPAAVADARSGGGAAPTARTSGAAATRIEEGGGDDTTGTAPRIVAGFASMFLPRTLGEALGLVRVGGGRGLWLFAELDTLVFDAVLLFAAAHLARVARSRARVTPTFALLLLIFVATAGPMLYAVTNFGTLFRLRQMLYLMAAIAPVTLAAGRAPSESSAAVAV